MSRPRRVALVVLDGVGVREESRYNAVKLAHTPFLRGLAGEGAAEGILLAAGTAVGLPDGQVGNSEVGHVTMGAGRVILQDLPRISRAIREGSFFKNPVLRDALERARSLGSAVHVLGLTSPGGVHSHTQHGLAVVAMARQVGIRKERLFWHAILDGRDSPPCSAVGYLEELRAELADQGARLASAIGRFYAMDRDCRWERTERAYRMLVEGVGTCSADLVLAVADSCARGVTDEFVDAQLQVSPEGSGPLSTLGPGDLVVMFNFRSDRARQLTRALALPDFDAFARPKSPRLSQYACLCEIDPTFGLPVAFPPLDVKPTLGAHLASLGLRQLRVAETEKYAHVTYFFNGGIEEPAPLEERVLVPSVRDVATYDLAPAMNAAGVADAVVRAIQEGDGPDFILANFANPDMVGHTGKLLPAIRAMEVVDGELRRLVSAARRTATLVLITADHGNCELMWDEQAGAPHTAHTVFPVPYWLIGGEPSIVRSAKTLADVAEIVTRLMGVDARPEWRGSSSGPFDLSPTRE